MLWSLQLRMRDRTKTSITYLQVVAPWQEWWSAHNIGVTSPKVEGLENSIVNTVYTFQKAGEMRIQGAHSTLYSRRWVHTEFATLPPLRASIDAIQP